MRPTLLYIKKLLKIEAVFLWEIQNRKRPYFYGMDEVFILENILRIP